MIAIVNISTLISAVRDEETMQQKKEHMPCGRKYLKKVVVVKFGRIGAGSVQLNPRRIAASC